MILEAIGISQDFEGEAIIKDINIHLKKGEIVCLIGSSGVGKTTLFHVLSGLENPSCGKVLLNGEEITGQAGRISYMLQKDLLLPHLTIADNIALPLVIRGNAKKDARKKAIEYFENFGLAGTEEKYPSQLSGGMRQTAYVAMALAQDTDYILFDEPTTYLDISHQLDLMRILRGLADSGK